MPLTSEETLVFSCLLCSCRSNSVPWSSYPNCWVRTAPVTGRPSSLGSWSPCTQGEGGGLLRPGMGSFWVTHGGPKCITGGGRGREEGMSRLRQAGCCFVRTEGGWSLGRWEEGGRFSVSCTRSLALASEAAFRPLASRTERLCVA